MNLDVYFPTPIWWDDISINNKEIEELCYRLQSESDGRQVSNVGGWQSHDFAPDTHPELKLLVETIYNSSKFCLSTYGFKEGSCKLTIGNMWININKEQNVNMVHTHGSAFLSGTYYVKVNRQSAPIMFYKNFADDFAVTAVAPVERHTQLSASTATYPPRIGRLLMFPAWLPHSVMPGETSDDRISIAFNLRMTQC